MLNLPHQVTYRNEAYSFGERQSFLFLPSFVISTLSETSFRQSNEPSQFHNKTTQNRTAVLQPVRPFLNVDALRIVHKIVRTPQGLPTIQFHRQERFVHLPVSVKSQRRIPYLAGNS